VVSLNEVLLLKSMTQSAPSVRSYLPAIHDIDLVDAQESPAENTANIWTSRITGAIGAVFLALGLLIWASRPGHYRLVLAFLVIAMLAAILRSYTFENGVSH
jgi:hypothetical protein